MWKSTPPLLNESHLTDDFPIFAMHSFPVSLHHLLQERGKETLRKAADAEQEGSRWENAVGAEALQQGRHSSSPSESTVRALQGSMWKLFPFQANDCKMLGTHCSLCKLAAQS